MKLTKKVVAFCAAGIMALAIFPIRTYEIIT